MSARALRPGPRCAEDPGLLDRAEGRDFTDLKALAEQFTKDDCIRWARDLDDGVRPSDVAAAMAKLERLHDADLPCFF